MKTVTMLSLLLGLFPTLCPWMPAHAVPAVVGGTAPIRLQETPEAGGTPQNRPDGSVSFTVKGQSRRAIVVNSGTKDQRRPTVIVLHGGQGNADATRRRTGFDALARKEGFAVVYAEGTRFGAEGLDQYAWNTGHLLRRQVRESDDIAYFDTLIDLLIRQHGADPKRIFMTGGSNGGMMTYVYAVNRPEKLAAAAPMVASMFSFDSVPKTPLPILIVNGAMDEEVPIGGGMSKNSIVRRAQATPFKAVDDVVQFWVKANRADAKPTTTVQGSVTTTLYKAGEGGAPVEVVVDAKGGHGWPGTRSRRETTAPPIAAFSGAQRVWEFFRNHARD